MTNGSSPRFKARVHVWQKLLLAFVAVILGTVAALGWLATRRQQETVEGQVLKAHREIASILAREIDGLLENAQRLLVATTKIPDVQSFDVPKIKTIFESLLSNFRIFTRMSVIGRDGDEVYSTLHDASDKIGRIWHAMVVCGDYDAIYISELNFTSGGVPSITMAVPIRDMHHAVVGIIVAELDLGIFGPAVERIRIGQTSVVSVIDREGRHIAHSLDSSLVGRKMAEDLDLVTRPLSDFTGPSGARLVSFVSLPSFRGNLGPADYRPPDWKVVFKQDADEAYAEAIRLRRDITLLSAALIGAAFIVAIVLALTVTRPIRRLVQEAGRLSSGDLDTPVLPTSFDEVGELARAFDEMRAALKKKIWELNTLYLVGQKISSVLNLSDLLKLILTKNIEILKADRGSLMLFDDETGNLEIHVGEGLDERYLTAQTDINAGVAGKVFRTGKPLLIRDALKSEELRELKGDGPVYPGTLLSVPLQVQDRILGVLNVAKSEPDSFDEKDLALFTALSVQGAIAIDNAVLYKLAITDGLTKLFLHRYFQQRLDNEISRSKRFGYKFTLLMTDIDHFKSYNDNYGHQNGDKVLKVFARIVQQNVREVDIAARYGGEEFAVILPEKSADDARVPAERLRQAVESFDFYVKEKRVPITISIGVASFPDDATDKLELIERADRALYFSKETGRNRVTLFCDIPEHLREKGDPKKEKKG